MLEILIPVLSAGAALFAAERAGGHIARASIAWLRTPSSGLARREFWRGAASAAAGLIFAFGAGLSAGRFL